MLMRATTDTDEARSLTGLFDEAAAYRSGKDYAELLAFAVRMRRFGPVGFVYDIQDTEALPGAPELPRSVFAFPATGNVSEAMLVAVAKAVAAKGIRIFEIDEGDWHAGRNRRAGDGYAVRINRNHARETRLATIAHELAHLHLGHLGADPKHKPRIPDRGTVRKEIQEVEAESVAYIVCRRRGVRPESASYLAQFIKAGEPVRETLDVERVMTAAGTVEAAMFPLARSSKRRKPMIWQDTGDTT